MGCKRSGRADGPLFGSFLRYGKLKGFFGGEEGGGGGRGGGGWGGGGGGGGGGGPKGGARYTLLRRNNYDRKSRGRAPKYFEQVVRKKTIRLHFRVISGLELTWYFCG